MTIPIQAQPIPIPPTLRKTLANPHMLWSISPSIFKRMEAQTGGLKYKKVQVRPTDKEWDFVWTYFHHDRPTKYDIGKIHCIHERHQTQAFEATLSEIERQIDNKMFKPNWQNEPRATQRATVIKRWENVTALFSPFDTIETDNRKRQWNQAKVLPLWHASSPEFCHSICESGFTFFGKVSIGKMKPSDPQSTDDGYFGSGIYGTNSSRYAADIYANGALLLGWFSMREPFPVVGDPQQGDMNALRGKGAYKHYNAHYIPVAPTKPINSWPIYYPCQEGKEPFCDELVVFKSSQVLTRFWIELEVSLPHLITPSGDPDFVEDLIPYFFQLLKNPAVDRDKKLKNFLKGELTPLLMMKGDDDLKLEHKNLYRQLIQVLDQSGNINQSVREILTQRVVKESERPSLKAGPSDETSRPDVVENSKTSSLNGPYQAVMTLAGHRKAVRTLAESNGILFSGDRSGELKIWSLINGVCLKTITYPREISSIYKDSDGNILTGSADGIVRIYNPKTEANIGQFKHGDCYVSSITQNSKGDYVTGGAQTKVWNKTTKKLIKSFPGVGGFVEVSSQEIALATGTENKKGDEPRVIICNHSGKQLRALRGHQKCIYRLIKLSDGKLATSSADGSVRIWDPTSGQCIQVFQGKGRMNDLIEISDDLIAATGQFPDISIWSRSTGQVVENTGWVHANSVLTLIKLDNGDLITGSNDKTIKVLRRTSV